jgi:hypothetical protein
MLSSCIQRWVHEKGDIKVLCECAHVSQHAVLTLRLYPKRSVRYVVSSIRETTPAPLQSCQYLQGQEASSPSAWPFAELPAPSFKAIL